MNGLQEKEVQKRVDKYIDHINENVQELKPWEEEELRASHREVEIDNVLNGRK